MQFIDLYTENVPIQLEHLHVLAQKRGAIGFDYSSSPTGDVDWYRLRYAWQGETPMQETESATKSPLPEADPIYEMIPPPEAERSKNHPKTLEQVFDLSGVPHIARWYAYTSNIPTMMKSERRWSVWQKQPDGKKIPYRILDGRHWSTSERCKSDTPETWTTFDEALLCFLNARGHLGGLSFALGDGYCGFDFDDVIVDSKMHPQAKSWLAQLGGYSEVSQSGKGQKTIIRGTLDDDFLGTAETGRQFKSIPSQGMATEVYDKKRFFYLTGNGSGEPSENQQAIDKICGELVTMKAAMQPPVTKRRSPKVENTNMGVKLSDEAILEKIRSSKQAIKFDALWNGQLGAYDSASEADMALTSMLMWWCGNDETQVERLFEQSELAKREKWDREDYRQRTLTKAQRSDIYRPRLPRDYKGATERIKARLNAAGGNIDGK